MHYEITRNVNKKNLKRIKNLKFCTENPHFFDENGFCDCELVNS